MALTDVFGDSTFYAGPPLTDDMLRDAEAALGFRLPAAHIELLRFRNGGGLRRTVCPTDFPTSWAQDHFAVQVLQGIGGRWGIDPTSELGGSAYLISEWDYPDIGVVFCMCPSAGHDVVMLDYSACGPDGEPSVAYIDEDRIPRTVAASFVEFIERLEPERTIEDETPAQ